MLSQEVKRYIATIGSVGYMPVTIFFCYAHEDEPLLNKLKAQLSPLQRRKVIDTWYDRILVLVQNGNMTLTSILIAHR